MTVNPSIDLTRLLEEQLAQAGPDLLRELLQPIEHRLGRRDRGVEVRRHVATLVTSATPVTPAGPAIPNTF